MSGKIPRGSNNRKTQVNIKRINICYLQKDSEGSFKILPRLHWEKFNSIGNNM
jgi:hypothetical protein